MGVPAVPLTQLYNAAGDYIETRQGSVQFRTSVESFRAELSHVKLGVNGKEEKFDFVVLAVPFDVLGRILPNSSASAPLRNSLARFESSPITGIHLLFDRDISELEHAVLLDRTIQWMFHKSELQERSSDGAGCERVDLRAERFESVEKSRQEIVDLALSEFREFFPAARDANLSQKPLSSKKFMRRIPRGRELKWIVRVPRRSGRASSWPVTGPRQDGPPPWRARCAAATLRPSRSRRSRLRDAAYLVPDLPATGFMRLFG
jgi:zeta-carotene desaturase